MTVRPAESDDFDPIAAITNHYILKTTVHWASTPVSPAELRDTWLAKREQYPYFVAVDPESGGVVGYAKAGPWRDRAAYARTAETGIYVAAESHGRRIGRRLYTALIDECRRRGFHALVAGVALPNDASIGLHATLGFTHVGTFREVGWKFDEWRDAAFFQLLL